MKHKIILSIITIVAVLISIITTVAVFIIFNDGYIRILLFSIIAANIIFVTGNILKAIGLQQPNERKPRLKNLFFVIPALIILLNYALLGISHYIQTHVKIIEDTITGFMSWNMAVLISDISFFIILACLITRLSFICVKKINSAEFLIWHSMNLIAAYLCATVIFYRI